MSTRSTSSHSLGKRRNGVDCVNEILPIETRFGPKSMDRAMVKTIPETYWNLVTVVSYMSRVLKSFMKVLLQEAECDSSLR